MLSWLWMLPLPLIYMALGFAAGYFFGKRSPDGKALRREASSVLDSIGKLHLTGALRSIDGMKVSNGNESDGVTVSIKTTAAPQLPPAAYRRNPFG